MRALAFDVFGTLFDVGSILERARGIVREPEEFVALWRRKQLEYTFLLSLMDRFMTFSEVTRRALQYTLRQLDARMEPSQLEALTEAWKELPLYPDVLPAMEILKDRFTLVVLSNGERSLLDALIRRVGLDGHFSHILSAEEVGTYKPSPRVYQLAAVKLGLAMQDVGLVSSNAFDVMGAKAAGLKTFWVNRGRAVLDPLNLDPDLDVRDFDELVRSL
ncbi:MAG: haloacid dehalogenase type II [Thermoplasmata archaeon]